MLTQNLYQISIDFLERSPQKRLLILKEMGLARYANFLTIMPLTEANIACIMRFFSNPSRAKFPNLQGVALSGLVLDGVNFIRGDLSGANLSNSSLVDADLIFANFTKANLSNANLQGTTLNETIWCSAIVKNCNFGVGIGITNKQRQELLSCGAVFKL
ncbi:pentapeptide repeat-containing protein [Synechocystis sp. PCC 7509]|uniref:pentapeptide repeat-containing protein n=1 Tax=Synechocystis sp. PCC 7509 TaxID=927677 RepID=UPI0002ABF3BE|nr:pentapeptide repeat-containing protein [Synechocystis sp. PCC 7509]